jgi:hypothetical protein
MLDQLARTLGVRLAHSPVPRRRSPEPDLPPICYERVAALRTQPPITGTASHARPGPGGRATTPAITTQGA